MSKASIKLPYLVGEDVEPHKIWQVKTISRCEIGIHSDKYEVRQAWSYRREGNVVQHES